MDAIIQDKENIRRMLESSGIDQLKIDTGQEYQSNETLREGVTINECLKTYEQIEEIVRINTMHPTYKPTTHGTIVDYVKNNNVSEENIVVVSSQPFNDYQILTSINAFFKECTLPQNVGGIGSGVSKVPSTLFGNHIAKLIYTILEILNRIGVELK